MTDRTAGSWKSWCAASVWNPQLNLSERVPIPRLQRFMRAADVFVFPSIREAGGAVVVEAMASGLPCVITDYGGPGVALTNECGIKIPLCNPDQLIGQFRDRLEQLALDSELRERLGAAARERALDLFAWDAKARMIVEIYRWVLGERQEKPDQYSPVNPDPMILESPASS